MTNDNSAIARAAYNAYVRKDRAAIEALIAEDFRFSSPLDNALKPLPATRFQYCLHEIVPKRPSIVIGLRDTLTPIRPMVDMVLFSAWSPNCSASNRVKVAPPTSNRRMRLHLRSTRDTIAR